MSIQPTRPGNVPTEKVVHSQTYEGFFDIGEANADKVSWRLDGNQLEIKTQKGPSQSTFHIHMTDDFKAFLLENKTTASGFTALGKHAKSYISQAVKAREFIKESHKQEINSTVFKITDSTFKLVKEKSGLINFIKRLLGFSSGYKIKAETEIYDKGFADITSLKELAQKDQKYAQGVLVKLAQQGNEEAFNALKDLAQNSQDKNVASRATRQLEKLVADNPSRSEAVINAFIDIAKNPVRLQDAVEVLHRLATKNKNENAQTALLQLARGDVDGVSSAEAIKSLGDLQWNEIDDVQDFLLTLALENKEVGEKDRFDIKSRALGQLARVTSLSNENTPKMAIDNLSIIARGNYPEEALKQLVMLASEMTTKELATAALKDLAEKDPDPAKLVQIVVQNALERDNIGGYLELMKYFGESSKIQVKNAALEVLTKVYDKGTAKIGTKEQTNPTREQIANAGKAFKILQALVNVGVTEAREILQKRGWTTGTTSTLPQNKPSEATQPQKPLSVEDEPMRPADVVETKSKVESFEGLSVLYQGELVNGKRDGRGILNTTDTPPDGLKSVEGEWWDGLLEGEVVKKYGDGREVKRTYRDGKGVGQEDVKYPNGRILHHNPDVEGSLKYLEYPNGNVWIVSGVDDKGQPEGGKGTLRSKDGSTFSGTIGVDGKPVI